MRDINRIDNFMEEVQKLWKENFPDWRFGQLITNFISWYETDLFYLEEDDFLKAFNKFVKEIKNK